MAIRPQVRALIGCLAIGSAVQAAASPTAAGFEHSTICLSPEIDAADRIAIVRLHAAAHFDLRLNMVTLPLTAAEVQELALGARSGRPSVQVPALILLASAVSQNAVPRATRNAIARAATPLVEAQDDSTPAETVRLYARRVLWHLRATEVGGTAPRADFLSTYLEERGQDGPYLAYGAVDYLAELGADGEGALLRLVAEGAKRSLDSELLERAQLALGKIQLSRAAAQASRADAVRLLARAARTTTRRRMDREFGVWIVGQLATRRPEADSVLRALGSDAGVTDEVQIAARFASDGGATSIRWRW